MQRPWNSSVGINTPCEHKINVVDAGLPATGIVEVLIEGFDFKKTLEINYGGTEQKIVKAGATIVLYGRRDGSHIILPVTFDGEGNKFTRDCLVDTGATLTTAPRSLLHVASTEERQFSTANGVVKMPIGKAMVSVGELSREISVAMTSSDEVSLLGANFFDDFVYTIDLENNAIYLIKR
jgi:predicted aspartyl protease